MTRIKRLCQIESRLPRAEEQLAALTQSVEGLRIQLEKQEVELELSRIEAKEAKKKADAAARALVEVRTALTILVDTVNRRRHQSRRQRPDLSLGRRGWIHRSRPSLPAEPVRTSWSYWCT